jgi:hypothetical protein
MLDEGGTPRKIIKKKGQVISSPGQKALLGDSIEQIIVRLLYVNVPTLCTSEMTGRLGHETCILQHGSR